MKEDYYEYLGNAREDAEKRDEVMAPIIEWYTTHLQNYVARRNGQGKMHKIVENALDAIIKLVSFILTYLPTPEHDLTKTSE